MRQQLKILAVGSTLAIGLWLVTLFGPELFDGMNAGILNTEYRIRGEQGVDSSIVLLYFDNSTISALGDFPIRRNIYALALKSLHELGADAVGVDIAFPEIDSEHPEYDNVLMQIVGQAGNVVLGGYFRSAADDDTSRRRLIPERLSYPAEPGGNHVAGNSIELPYRELLDSAAGFGHTNLTDPATVALSLHIPNSSRSLAAFPFETWRVAAHLSHDQVQFRADEAVVEVGEGRAISIPAGSGTVSLNFPGGLSSLTAFPVAGFLNAYDTLIGGGSPALPVGMVRGKIVLLGVIAEGRSSFVETPFAAQFPSLGLHAVFIHDLLHQSFLRPAPEVLVRLLPIVLSLLVVLLISMKRELLGLLGIGSVFLVLVAASYYLFAAHAVVLPVAASLVCTGIVGMAMLVFKHQSVRAEVGKLTNERQEILRKLEEREERLRGLEASLRSAQSMHAQRQVDELQEQVRQHQDEVAKLKVQSDDFVPFAAEPDARAGKPENLHGIIYLSTGALSDVISFVKKIATNDATVLILGESGTGKELVARALHLESNRREKPFIAVNCGALSETLLESELFGHERGAFTGAVKERQGRFELAHGGTIFLDEIADTSEAFQVKMLRVLQEGTFERVGGTTTHKVDVRIIAATNRELKQMVGAKQFREDLYYRLNVISIQLPPLRERPDDIPLLVESFLASDGPGLQCSATVMYALQQHGWRGNVRELQSVVKRAALLARADERPMLRLKDLPEDVAAAANSALDLEERILRSLQEKKFSRSAISDTAADLGGLNRGTVSEYFRGYCFKKFADCAFRQGETVRAIAGDDDPETVDRVARKLAEYLSNAVEFIDRAGDFQESLKNSRSKFKNLPQRYHESLQAILEAHHRGDWNVSGVEVKSTS
jgi:transcriptional regulator with GAF, ATPase, and Fis domain